MYDLREWESPPRDSSDLLAMGLRAPRCNGCTLAEWRWKLGDRFLMLPKGVYELDAEPRPGQGEPRRHGGRPIRFHFWGMSYGHSDECYHWSPSADPPRRQDAPSIWERLKRRVSKLRQEPRPESPAWYAATGKRIPIDEMDNRHLLNAYLMLKRQGSPKTAAVLRKEMMRREWWRDRHGNWRTAQGCVIGYVVMVKSSRR